MTLPALIHFGVSAVVSGSVQATLERLQENWQTLHTAMMKIWAWEKEQREMCERGEYVAMVQYMLAAFGIIDFGEFTEGWRTQARLIADPGRDDPSLSARLHPHAFPPHLQLLPIQ
jgi:hypothetical protein